MSGAVEIKGLCFGYPDAGDVLADINLRIDGGSKVALIGPNGAGKSTLLLAMSMFVEAKGSIVIDGIEAVRKNTRDIRKVIGSVLQDPEEQLFMPTVFDDVAFGPMNLNVGQEEVIRRTNEALQRVGLAGLEKRPPHHLSAGQKRAAAIATILSMEPKVITMDEPDTSLDPRSRKRLVELLRSLEQTLIIATCNMDFAARVCERAVLMDGGRIIADGNARQVMADADLMEAHGLETPKAFGD
jgi:cobalt/nickel transport system ATP-binding protein